MKYKEFWISEATGQGEYDHVFFDDKPAHWKDTLYKNQFHAIEYKAYIDALTMWEKLAGALRVYAESEYVDVKKRGYHPDGTEDLEIDDDGTIARQALEELEALSGK